MEQQLEGEMEVELSDHHEEWTYMVTYEGTLFRVQITHNLRDVHADQVEYRWIAEWINPYEEDAAEIQVIDHPRSLPSKEAAMAEAGQRIRMWPSKYPHYTLEQLRIEKQRWGVEQIRIEEIRKRARRPTSRHTLRRSFKRSVSNSDPPW
jgi:hypothetical protein